MHFEFEFRDSGYGQFVKYWGGDGQVQLSMTVDDRIVCGGLHLLHVCTDEGWKLLHLVISTSKLFESRVHEFLLKDKYYSTTITTTKHE